MQNQEEIDFNTREMGTEELLGYAGYYTYKAISCRAPRDLINDFENSRELYYGLRFSVSATSKIGNYGTTGNESVDKVIAAAMKNMHAHYREVIIEEKKSLKQQEVFFDYARGAFQHALDACNSTDGFEKCASAIELQLDDKKWANEIRKRAYGNNWIPDKDEDIKNLDAESTHNEYVKLAERFESDLMQYFMQRQPANYGKYAD